jgi:hypothetical protein
METKANSFAADSNMPKRLGVSAVIVALVLMIPFVTNAPWTGSDYLFAGIVLSLCALVYVFATKNMPSRRSKALVAAAILLFIFLVIGWAATGP